MKNRETRKSFSFPEAIYVWLQSIQMAVNWSPGSTGGWFASDCLATPGTVACQNQHQLARLPGPQVAVQAIHWRHLGPPTTCPTMPLPGVITGHYGLGPVSRAGRNKPSGHLYYWGWPLIPSGFGHLPQGPGSACPGAVSQFHHAPFQLTCF